MKAVDNMIHEINDSQPLQRSQAMLKRSNTSQKTASETQAANFDKIELGQILVSCLIILGFSLTLITYFQNDPQFDRYRNIIFWLIILPFGIEAILVSLTK